jgi:mannose-6-phosphate isomerase class I
MNPTDPASVAEAISRFRAHPQVARLIADVQHYAWGDADFIPALMGVANPQRTPFAELWMGAHPDLPSRVLLGGIEVPLDALTSAAPHEVLGPSVAAKFDGRLPYLFKVLSAAAPLSIQAHPTKAEAEAGFARENAAGIPLSAKARNYKDDNHKPELIAALTDFYALRGFRPLNEIARLLVEVPELHNLMPKFQPSGTGLASLYEKLMTMPQDQVNHTLDSLVARLAEANGQKPFTRMQPEYWILKADRTFSAEGRRDRGLFSVLLLNLVHLQPGQAMYLSAGILHAYLEGSGIEIMANSNNVLRGGLTPKHVDVPELLHNVVFEGGEAEVLQPVSIGGSNEWAYRTPASEFELRRIDLSAEAPYHSGSDHGAEILILAGNDGDATVHVTSDEQTLEMTKGNVCLAPFGVEYSIRAGGSATLYKAIVP